MCDVKVMTVVGTRPEIIRLAAAMKRLDSTEGIDHVLVHTGQNWDRQLNAVFFEDLGLRLPDHVLDVDVSSLGATLGDILRKTETVLEEEKPDAFLVLSGTGEIRLRKLFTDQVVSFPVNGAEPAIVDMPTFWVHSITNTGTEPLVTLFFADELYDPANPDTIPEDV